MPLSHQLLTAPGAQPSRWMFFLHGILGSGRNWTTFARRVVETHPQWGAVLIDLRMHGGSQQARPPHSIAATAEDLVALEPSIPGPVRGGLGHSFGGKVMLAYLQRRGSEISNAFLLDSNPGPRLHRSGSETTLEVLAVLDGLPSEFPTKSAFVSALREKGIERGIAEWLALNLRPEGDSQRFGLDLRAIHDLLDDYFATDYWPVLEQLSNDTRLDVVLGSRSNVFDAQARARLQAIAAQHPNVHLHTVNAGHWVHVDAPDEVFTVVSGALAATS